MRRRRVVRGGRSASLCIVGGADGYVSAAVDRASTGMPFSAGARIRADQLRFCLLALLALAAGVTLAATLDATSLTVPSAVNAPLGGAGGAASTIDSLRGLPLAEQAVISRTLGSDAPALRMARTPTGRLAVNAGGLKAGFAHRGVTIATGGAALTLAAPRAATLTAAGNRATYTSANEVESFLAGPLGLEQTITVPRRPHGPLQVTTQLRTALRAHMAAGVLTLSAGQSAAIRYGGLSAVDAAGRHLRAWMTLVPGNRLRIRVADAGARFPVRIDPFLQTAELGAADAATGAGFGDSVAVSDTTIVVGAPAATVAMNSAQGAVYVFTSASPQWSNTVTATKLTVSTGAPGDHFGISVAVSGSVVVVGAYDANGGAGAAYVFQEPSGGWAAGPVAAPSVLTASDGTSSDGLGFAVATNGTTVVAGARHAISGVAQPVLYVFDEPQQGWASAAGSTELAVSGATSMLAGHAVAIAGTTIVAGGYGANDNEGAAYVFVPPPGGWSSTVPNYETATLASADPVAGDNLGWSVAISGSTVAAGAPGADSGQGAVDVFQEPAAGWGTPATQTADAALTVPAATPGGKLGYAVAIETSDAPATIAAGAPDASVGANAYQGAVDVFQAGADGWQGATGQTLIAGDGAADDELGGSAGTAVGALGIDGSTIVAGAAFHVAKTGSAYVFQSPTTATGTATPTGTSPSTTPTGAPTSTMSVPLRATVKGRITVRAGGRVTDTVSCSGPAGASCRVTERLNVVEKVRAKKVIAVTARATRRRRRTSRRTVVCATATLSIPVGASRTFALKLNGAGRRLLAHRKRLPVKFIATLATGGHGTTTFAQRTLTLKPAKRKPKRKTLRQA